ncbi:MAG TPA: metal-sulfur cluster assembly factor [Egibacteraceae bacterium]|nr:metal-sulfur cluster assembly factor [Egibacteraceae bacterium]
MSDAALQGWPIEPEPGTPEYDAAQAQAQVQVQAFADVPLDDDGLPTDEAVRTALKAVLDPEIGINIVDLGLVYGVEKEPPGKVKLTMTLTSLGCPLTELIHQQCTMILTRLPGVEDVDVNFVFSPPWSTEMIAPEAKDELRAMGFSV